MNFFSKTRLYVKESFVELMQKVSWPTWSELQSSAIIVMVASLIFAVIVSGMDILFKFLVGGIYKI